jgi:hypothetical protein
MMLIGISGKYCAGKNAVAAILEKRGFFLIDADKLGHEALSRKKGRIVERFGKGILRPDGSVDRKRLGAMSLRIGRPSGSSKRSPIPRYVLRRPNSCGHTEKRVLSPSMRPSSSL